MKINRWKKTILTIVSVSFCFVLAFSGQAAGSYAILEKFSGEVMIKNAEEWLQPQPGMSLYSGAKIVTKDGTAFIVFKDGATMQVDPYSSIRAIDQIRSKESLPGEPARIRRLRIMLGRAKYEEQPIPGRKTRVELPTAVAALRGTGGWFGADETQASKGSLYEGNMDVSGIFQEIIPQILSLEDALSSPTWSASLNSAGNPDNPLANVQEIQAELETFSNNVDPEIQDQVQKTLNVIVPVLSQIQEKLEKAKISESQKATADKAVASATPETPALVTETNKLASSTNQTFMEITRESTKTDISLILETLKSNPDSITIAQQAKQRNDLAVEIAEKAVVTSVQAAELASRATDAKQLETAASVARTAASTSQAVKDIINTTNTSTQLLAQENEAGLLKSGSLNNLADKTLAAAEKTNQLAQNTLLLAQKEETSDTAVNTAMTLESSSKTIEESAQKTSQAAQSVVNNDPEADQLIEQTLQDDQAIDQINQTLDAENEKIAPLIPESETEETEEEAEEEVEETAGEEATEETTREEEAASEQDTEETVTEQETDLDAEEQPQEEEEMPEQETPAIDETTPVYETDEPENPQERDFVDDDDPASPV